MTIIREQSSDEEIIKLSNEIIDILIPLNVADKWKVISSLHSTLKDTINEMGGDIIEIIKEGGDLK